MAATCVQGAFGQLAILQGSSPYTWANATRLPFYQESLQCLDTVGVPDVIVGSRTEPSERARRGPQVTRGDIMLPVSPKELDTLLPLFLGAAESTDVFALAETIPSFGCIIDKVSDVFGYVDGVVDQAVLRGVQAGPGAPPNFLVLMLRCLFKDEDDTVASFPALSLGTNSTFVPYTFEDGVYTLDGTARTPKAFTWSVNNHIDEDGRWVNSLKPVLFCPARRTVALSLRMPADTDHVALRKIALAGIAGSLAFTNGSLSTTVSFPCLQAPRNTPFITGKTEIGFTANFIARGLGASKEVEVTNDSTA